MSTEELQKRTTVNIQERDSAKEMWTKYVFCSCLPHDVNILNVVDDGVGCAE